MDNVAVSKVSPKLDNDKAWVNFVFDPENAAMITNYALFQRHHALRSLYRARPRRSRRNQPACGCAGARIPPDLLARRSCADRQGLDQLMN